MSNNGAGSDATSPRTNPWLVFLLPFVVFLLVGSLEPTPEKLGGAGLGLSIPYRAYAWVYTAKIVLTALAVAFVLPGYRQFPLRVSPLAVAVGVVGIVVWVGLGKLDLEERILGPLGLGQFLGLGERSAYNPLDKLADRPAWARTFLAVRFFGLAALVPLVEEGFLRGFLLRFIQQRDWWKVPFGQGGALVVAVAAGYGMVSHPAELVAAAAWFSMVTWLMLRTRNFWDCVAAHAVTNLLLGVYVVWSGEWHFM
ncbi:MAG: CAAX prenyl protease-related protein [Pirellulales bacterium]|nr:CAAX prenyl protease-related protein [Pirellulales bacterium]